MKPFLSVTEVKGEMTIAGIPSLFRLVSTDDASIVILCRIGGIPFTRSSLELLGSA